MADEPEHQHNALTLAHQAKINNAREYEKFIVGSHKVLNLLMHLNYKRVISHNFMMYMVAYFNKTIIKLGGEVGKHFK